jgi:hypothetical protein
MLKYAMIFLIISLIAGASRPDERLTAGKAHLVRPVRTVFLIFLALIGFAYLVGAAIDRSALSPALTAIVAT